MPAGDEIDPGRLSHSAARVRPVHGAKGEEARQMAERSWLAEQFEQSRPHLQAVAYSMLGTVGEAQDAVQEAWLRLDRSETGPIADLQGWLTTVVGRISLDMLRARKARREYAMGSWLPEPLIGAAGEDPERQAELADSVSLALLVVLESLSPAERLSFVLHDVFAVPFGDIARIMDRTPDSARQLASRARRRVQAAPQPDPDPARQRALVDAFLAAAQAGDFAALVAVLDPDVVFRADTGPASPLARPPLTGAGPVARHVLATAPRFASLARPVLVNGAAGALFGSMREPVAVLGFTITGGRIAALDLIADPAKLAHLAIAPCSGRPGPQGGSS
ncbi:MAG TPA: RNA polymerase sigma factor SigJ [Streptosporangiaceae bacterium]